jgi:hypothetical protein
MASELFHECSSKHNSVWWFYSPVLRQHDWENWFFSCQIVDRSEFGFYLHLDNELKNCVMKRNSEKIVGIGGWGAIWELVYTLIWKNSSHHCLGQYNR